MPAGANLKAYNSLWQLRNDTWSSLEESAIQLARAEAQQRPVEKLVETVTELLDVLGPIERFWAFPEHRPTGRLSGCSPPISMIGSPRW